jgi:hypothetical protein
MDYSPILMYFKNSALVASLAKEPLISAVTVELFTSLTPLDDTHM